MILLVPSSCNHVIGGQQTGDTTITIRSEVCMMWVVYNINV